MQLRRADLHRGRFVARYLRRLAGLALFGSIASGVFGYNVLLGYAIWGVPLLFVRRWFEPGHRSGSCFVPRRRRFAS